MRILIWLALLISVFAASNAAACSKTTSFVINSAYVLPETKEVIDRGPSSVVDGVLVCGNFTVDVTAVTSLSTRGEYGQRGYGDEVDFTVTYNRDIETPVGLFQLQASSAYWKLAPFKRKDDIVQLYGEVSKSWQVSNVTVSPFVRATQWVGFGNMTDVSFIRPGVRVSLPVSNKDVVALEVSQSQNLTDRYGVTYASATAVHDFGKGWRGWVNALVTENTRSQIGFGITKMW